MSITIGKLSQATAVNVETIRYYERIGLRAVADVVRLSQLHGSGRGAVAVHQAGAGAGLLP